MDGFTEGTFWVVIIALFCVVGFLASIFDWEWYFNLTWKSRFWGNVFGRKAYRIFNAIASILLFAGAVYLLIHDLG